MLWQPDEFDHLFPPAGFVFDGGIYKPASMVPKKPADWWGVTGGHSSPTVDDILSAMKKAAHLIPPPPIGPSILKPPTLGDIATGFGIPKGILDGAPIVYSPPSLMPMLPTYHGPAAWESPGYDIRSLPADPAVTLHPHPCAISPARAREITCGRID